MLMDSYNLYLKKANLIKNWKSLSQREIANACLQYKDTDQELYSQYFSCLVIIFWYKIMTFAEKSQSSKNQLEDYVDWLIDTIELALKYHYWTLPENLNDEKAIQKAINRCADTIRQRYYYQYNLDKHKANYLTDSLDAKLDDLHDSFYLLEDDTYSDNISKINFKSIIGYFKRQKDILSIILLDAICWQDTFTVSTKKKKFTINDTGEEVEDSAKVYNYDFSLIKLNKYIRNQLNSNVINYLIKSYNLSDNLVIEEVANLQKLSQLKLNKLIAQKLLDLRNNEELKKLVC